MKILILVLSCRRSPYDVLLDVQRRTWDRLSVEGVETRYYFGEGFDSLPERLKSALDEVAGESWDFLFRTNSSSYVDKRRLVEFAGTLPRERCYCGVDGYRRADAGVVSDVPLQGGGTATAPWFASGSGFFVSRDCVEILRREISVEAERVPDVVSVGGEDVVVGRVMKRFGVRSTLGRRYDYWASPWVGREEEIRSAYHVRCKGVEDRRQDVVAMTDVYRIKVRNL